MRLNLFIFLAIPLCVFPQYKRVVFVEGGTSQNQSLKPHEVFTGFAYSYNNQIWNCRPTQYYTVSKVHNKTAFSSYGKIGIERPLSEQKYFSVSVPLAFGYRQYEENILADIEQFESGYSYNYKISLKTKSEIIGLSFGPKFLMNFKRWTAYANLNFNTEFILNVKSEYVSESDLGNVHTNYVNVGPEDPLFTIGFQHGLVWHLNEKIGIGLVNELFLYNVNTYYYESEGKQYNHLFNLNYGTNSTIINTGLRLQYSF